MSVFKRRRFPTEIVLACVRWYCRYGISYRDLAEMMHERGITVDHTTIFCWVQRYAPEIEKRVRWYQGYRAPIDVAGIARLNKQSDCPLASALTCSRW
jgi:transposase, IS6 family